MTKNRRFGASVNFVVRDSIPVKRVHYYCILYVTGAGRKCTVEYLEGTKIKTRAVLLSLWS